MPGYDRKRLFLSAGEASGDAYAEALVKAIRKQDDAYTFEGVGGPLLRAQGVTLHADSSKWGAISITESVKIAIRLIQTYLKLKKALITPSPGIFIPIDFGFVNIRLCRHAKKHGWKVLYFVPPSSWRRDRQGGDLPSVTDAIVTPFPWSRDLLMKAGANVFWFGHPLLDLMDVTLSETHSRQGIAVLPGSRKHEIREHLPVLAEGLPPEEKATFAIAPNVNLEELKAKWRELAPSRTEDVFEVGNTMGVLLKSERAVVCSGTATLQAAVAHTPTVLIYKVSKVMQVEAALLGFGKKVKFVGLPNLLLDRMIVPELVGLDCEAEGIRHWLDLLRDDQGIVAAQLEGFKNLDEVLGERGAIEKTANLICTDPIFGEESVQPTNRDQ